MSDTEPQTAGGKVLWHFLMSLDGFVAGLNHSMDWMAGFSVRPDLRSEYIETTDAVLGRRDGWNVINDNRPYGGAWHGMSLDGFAAGPNHAMDWMTGFSVRPDLQSEYIETTDAVLGRRDGWDLICDSRLYGGAWHGPIFVLTHHSEDAMPADGVTFLNCDPAEAVRIGLEAAGGKNLEVFSPTIGRQLLERGLIDEIDLHIAPILLGEGIRLYSPGGKPIRLTAASCWPCRTRA
ncbi:dihydrofolate reductase family protein [Nonomuraea sp. NPDC050536]|uniref:dihydrofolate reductase family protein n=1 Tax=Nonomuraea sp. NPDC050536 TaxID=3364366 RepID=UPI0037C906A9